MYTSHLQLVVFAVAQTQSQVFEHLHVNAMNMKEYYKYDFFFFFFNDQINSHHVNKTDGKIPKTYTY